jgi:hypothetical protein
MIKIQPHKRFAPKGLLLAIAIPLTAFIADSSSAQSYRWVDEQGVTHFSEQAPEQIDNPETVKTNRSVHSKNESTKADRLLEKEEYQAQRQALQQQMERTPSAERREQLKRQIQQLDLSWYRKYDPEKATELEKEMSAPKVRELPAEKPASNMDRYKAFY